MNTPYQSGGAGRDAPHRDDAAIGRAGHYTCAVLGGALVLALTVVYYSALVALTRPLGLFSTTAMVMGVAAAVGLAWLTLELAWAWRAGRHRRS